jgi:hypothetical protein
MPTKKRALKETAVTARKVNIVDCQVAVAPANQSVEAQDHQRRYPGKQDTSSRGHISPQSTMQRRLQDHRDLRRHTRVPSTKNVVPSPTSQQTLPSYDIRLTAYPAEDVVPPRQQACGSMDRSHSARRRGQLRAKDPHRRRRSTCSQAGHNQPASGIGELLGRPDYRSASRPDTGRDSTILQSPSHNPCAA